MGELSPSHGQVSATDPYQPTKSLSNLRIPAGTEIDPFSLRALQAGLTHTSAPALHDSLQRVDQLIAASDSILSELSASINERYGDNPKTLEFIQVAKEGDDEKLRQMGFDTSYGQIEHVLAAMIRGRPPIDIETVGPYAAAHETKAGKLEIKMKNLPSEEVAGILTSAALRRFASAIDSKVRIVSLVDELNNYASDRSFTHDEQDEYVQAITEFYKSTGLIKDGDIMGKDVLLLRESSQAVRVPELINKLKESASKKNIGQVVESNGTVTFWPSGDFVKSLGLRSKNRRKEFEKKGIVLIENGRPLCQAMDAASFLNEENRYLMHVVMLDRTMEAQQDKVYAILRALDIISSSTQYHNIFADMTSHSALPPELVVFATISHFRKAAISLKEFSYSISAGTLPYTEAA